MLSVPGIMNLFICSGGGGGDNCNGGGCMRVILLVCRQSGQGRIKDLPPICLNNVHRHTMEQKAISSDIVGNTELEIKCTSTGCEGLDGEPGNRTFNHS